MRIPLLLLTGLSTLLLTVACSRPKPILVGARESIEQQLLGEIIAQHLEHRLTTPVERRFGVGDVRTIHQMLLDGQVSVYPEYSGLIVSEILRETPNAESDITFERARQELKRLELVEYLAPFGFQSTNVLVVRAEGNEGLISGSDAAASPTRWKVAIPLEFQNRPTGIPSLGAYRLEMGAPLRSMKDEELFAAMEDKNNPANMVVSTLTDGHLTQPQWKALSDNLSSFAPADAAILVRDEVLTAEPNLRDALLQLGGKISVNTMRQLNARAGIEGRPVPEVAAEFLKAAGLK